MPYEPTKEQREYEETEDRISYLSGLSIAAFDEVGTPRLAADTRILSRKIRELEQKLDSLQRFVNSVIESAYSAMEDENH